MMKNVAAVQQQENAVFSGQSEMRSTEKCRFVAEVLQIHGFTEKRDMLQYIY